MLVLTALYAVATIVTTAVFGHWSDRLGRRKIFVIWSGIVSGVASLILAIAQTWPAAVAAAIVLGCAFGIYTAVDFALITAGAAAAEERAKDLGVINIANALPQVLAPVLAGAILVAGRREAGGSVATRRRRLVGRLRRRLPGRRSPSASWARAPVTRSGQWPRACLPAPWPAARRPRFEEHALAATGRR